MEIEITKYDDLIAAKTKLDILRNAYIGLQPYELESTMYAIFGSKPDGGESDAE